MDMEVWLESLTAEAETIENAETNDQGGSLPENREEIDSVIETVNPDNSVVRTTSLSSMDLFDVDTSVVTAAETVAAQNDEEYNVIFCVDTRDLNGTFNEFNSYIEKTIEKIRNSTRPKANIYWCDNFGNNRSNLWNSDENNDSRLYYNDSAEIYDPANGVNTALRHCDYNPALDTYVFIIFSATEVESSIITATNLLEKIVEINKEDMNLHISTISDSSTYVDTAFLPKRIAGTQGTKIAPKSADEVSADVLDYLGAEVVVKIISSTGLKRLGADFSKERILEYYKAYKSGNGDHLTDTDGDGLGNYKEIAFGSKLIKFTPDMELPTLSDCINYSNYTYVVDGLTRYKKNKTGNDPVKWESLINSVLVLPIFSDPTSVDGDEDGILDTDEFVWNGIDERYKNISPLKADTVESIYSDLLQPGSHNSNSNPIYLEIRRNHIKINIRYTFTSGDSALKKEVLLGSAAEIWSQSYDIPDDETNDKILLDYFKGKLYDFYPGMKITVELNFIETIENSIDIITFDKTVGERSNIDESTNIKWHNNPNSKIRLYRTQVVDTPNFTDEEQFYIFSHELGHAMGIEDAYAEANDGYQIYTDYTDPNLEFPFIDSSKYGAFDAGEIMVLNGQPCSNDLEMILQAFVEGRKQSFYPSGRISFFLKGRSLSISKAIKNPVIVYEKIDRDDDGKIIKTTYRIWERKSNTYKDIYNKTDMLEHVSELLKIESDQG
jgi:hypothetical protein